MTLQHLQMPIRSDSITGRHRPGARFVENVIFSLFVAGSVCGCASYEAKPIDPAETAVKLESRRLDDSGLHEFIDRSLKRTTPDWPLPEWNLEALTLAAFYYHPDLDVARAQWAVASAKDITAGQRANPNIGVTPGYNTSSDIPSPWIVSATLDIPFSTAGKRSARIAEAAQLSESVRFNVASVAWQVRGRVRQGLLDVYAAQESLRLLREQQGLADENVRLLERQLDAGGISSFELTQARLERKDVRLAVLDAERASAESRIRLAGAIGVSVSALDGVSLSFDSFGDAVADPSVSDSRRRALSNRADVLAALSEYAASQAALQHEIANQYPDIALGPGYEYDQGDNKWSLGLSFALPIVAHNRGGIAEARARREESAARFEALQARVLTEIDTALAGYRVALKSREEAESMVADVTEQQIRSRAMFAAGDISRSDLLGLELQLGAATIARFDAVIKARQAAGLLEDALQLPLDVPASAWQNEPFDSATVSATAR